MPPQDLATVERVFLQLRQPPPEKAGWTDEVLAGKLGMRPSHVRSCLYRLFDMGVARYQQSTIKKPDTGQKWQVFHWFPKQTPPNPCANKHETLPTHPEAPAPTAAAPSPAETPSRSVAVAASRKPSRKPSRATVRPRKVPARVKAKKKKPTRPASKKKRKRR